MTFYRNINVLDSAQNGKPLTTIAIATTIATPSTQSTGGSSSFLGVPKSWKRPNAREITAATDRRI